MSSIAQLQPDWKCTCSCRCCRPGTLIGGSRRETLSRGWFGKLGAPALDDVVPGAALETENGLLAWRALRLGDVQLTDVAHLAEDQAAGRALERMAAEPRRIERGAA